MYRHVFGSDEVADLVMRVIGEIEPVGETHTDYSDVVHFYNGCGTANIEISHDNGIVHLWFTTPVKLSGEPLSSCIFEGKSRRVL